MSGRGGASQGSGGVASGGRASTGGGASVDAGTGRGGDGSMDDGGSPFDGSLCPPGSSSPSSSRQTAKQLGTTTAPNGYLEYLPSCFDKSVGMPLLVFWHGIGEDGDGKGDLSKVASWGPPKVIAMDKWDAARPFVVLSPQYTATNGNIEPGGGCPSSAIVDAFLTWAISSYKVDKKRIYLTGLSCGAIGSWDYLANFEGTVVAAAVLLSGNPGDPMATGSAWKRAGCSLGEVALWSFHGDADSVVPYAPDQATTQALIACPEPPRRDARFTNIPGGGHIIWDPIYDLSGRSGDIYQWMLTNAKP